MKVPVITPSAMAFEPGVQLDRWANEVSQNRDEIGHDVAEFGEVALRGLAELSRRDAASELERKTVAIDMNHLAAAISVARIKAESSTGREQLSALIALHWLQKVQDMATSPAMESQP